ncbi:MAG: hypothetical protein ACLP59_07800 [Bryobacteraceae bacterium]
MIYRAAVLLGALTGGLFAQGTQPRASEWDYPAHANMEEASIGAEYLVHSFSNGRDLFIAKDYLVVEVALFPAVGRELILNAGQFSLRLNGRKQALSPEPAELLADSLKHPDTNGGLTRMAQLGPVILGAPQPTERFPGDPNGTTRRVPPNPGDKGSDTSEMEKQPPVKAEDLAVQAALPDGPCHIPTSGFLYFPYRGKIDRIHSLELVYSGPGGSAILPLPLQ